MDLNPSTVVAELESLSVDEDKQIPTTINLSVEGTLPSPATVTMKAEGDIEFGANGEQEIEVVLTLSNMRQQTTVTAIEDEFPELAHSATVTLEIEGNARFLAGGMPNRSTKLSLIINASDGVDEDDPETFSQVTFNPSPTTVSEGGEGMRVTMTMNPVPAARTTVRLMISDEDQIAVSSREPVFMPGPEQSEFLITVTARDDASSEDTETHTVSVLPPVEVPHLAVRGELSVVVPPSDPVTVTVSLNPMTVDEGDKAAISFSVAGMLPGPVPVTLTAQGDIGLGEDEDDDPKDRIMIDLISSGMAQGATVTAIEDEFPELAHSAMVTLVIEGNAHFLAAGKPSRSTELSLSINESKGPEESDFFRVTFDPDAVTVEEGMERESVLTITPAPTVPTTVRLMSSDEDQIAVSPREPVFMPGQPDPVITVMAVMDNTAEEEASYTVSVLPPDEVPHLAVRGGLSVVVPPSDPVTVTVSLNPMTVNEGDQAAISFSVAGMLPGPVPVTLTAQGDIGLGEDEDADPKDRIMIDLISSGMAQGATVTAFEDEFPELAHSATVTLVIAGNAHFVAGGKPSRSTELSLNINESKGPEGRDFFRVTFDPDAVTVEEGMERESTLTITPAPTVPTTVRLASSDEDHVTVMPEEVTFMPRETSSVITVTAVMDNTAEEETSYTISVLPPAEVPHLAVQADPLHVTVPVHELGTVMASLERGNVNEGEQIRLTLSVMGLLSPAAATVTLTAEGDIALDIEEVVFTQPSASQDVNITAIDDRVPEFDHPATVTLTVEGDARFLSAEGELNLRSIELVLTINEADGLYRFSFVDGERERDAIEVSEGEPDYDLALRITPTPPADMPITVELKSSDEAQVKVMPERLTFYKAPNPILGLMVMAVDDPILEATIVYTITVRPVQDIPYEQPAELLVAVRPDSRDNVIAVLRDILTIREGTTTAVELFSAPTLAEPASVILTAEGPSSGRIGFGADASTMTEIQIIGGVAEEAILTAIDNTLVEQRIMPATITLAVGSGPSDIALELSAAQIQVLIEDDDLYEIAFLEPPALRTTVREGESSTAVLVVLNDGRESTPLEPITVNLVPSDENQLAADPVVFSASTKAAVITAIDDVFREDTETYTVCIAVPQGVRAKEASASNTVMVDVPIDEEDTTLKVTVMPRQITIREGSTRALTVEAPSGLTARTTVTLMANSDIISLSSTEIVLSEGTTSAEAVVSAEADGMVSGELERQAEIRLAIQSEEAQLFPNDDPIQIGIREDDRYLLSFMPSPIEMTEGSSTEVRLVIVQNFDADQVRVQLTVQPQPESGMDRLAVEPLVIVFTPDRTEETTEETITITAMEGSASEDGEPYTISASIDDGVRQQPQGDADSLTVTVFPQEPSSIRIRIRVYLEGALR